MTGWTNEWSCCNIMWPVLRNSVVSPLLEAFRYWFNRRYFLLQLEDAFCYHQSCHEPVKIKYSSNKSNALCIFFFLNLSTIFKGKQFLFLLFLGKLINQHSRGRIKACVQSFNLEFFPFAHIISRYLACPTNQFYDSKGHKQHSGPKWWP